MPRAARTSRSGDVTRRQSVTTRDISELAALFLLLPLRDLQVTGINNIPVIYNFCSGVTLFIYNGEYGPDVIPN